MNLKLLIVKYLLKSRKVSYLNKRNIIFYKYLDSPKFKIEQKVIMEKKW